jgi:hypothetical protein
LLAEKALAYTARVDDAALGRTYTGIMAALAVLVKEPAGAGLSPLYELRLKCHPPRATGMKLVPAFADRETVQQVGQLAMQRVLADTDTPHWFGDALIAHWDRALDHASVMPRHVGIQLFAKTIWLVLAGDDEEVKRMAKTYKDVSKLTDSCGAVETAKLRHQGPTLQGITCHNCGQEGHKQNACTVGGSYRPSRQQGRGGRGRGRNDPGCWNCGSLDHIARACPSPPRPQPRAGGRRRPGSV